MNFSIGRHATAKLFFCFVGCFALSCEKFLDAKSDQKLAFPTSVKDLQALLDDFPLINERGPIADEASADNYYLTTDSWQTLSTDLQRIYAWEKDYLFQSGIGNDWSNGYSRIYIANLILDNIDEIKHEPNELQELSNIKGQALFLRAKSYLELAFIFCLAYSETSNDSDLGLPLRLDADFNKKIQRSNLGQTYSQIISDFKEAIPLLPINVVNPVRASKPAAYAFLARTYLAMGKYTECLENADLCLELKDDLMNFESDPDIETSGAYRIKRFNKEVIFDGYSSSNSSYLISSSIAKVDSLLYLAYDNNDCRKTLFFFENSDPELGTYQYCGGYMQSDAVFSGIAVDEVLLMRAECHARKGNVSMALDDLNGLIVTRWKDGTYQPYNEATPEGALNKILQERRKELIFRGVRWMDIKRLNKEGANIILKRILNGVTVILGPNDLRFALPIPEDVISISGIQQNRR